MSVPKKLYALKSFRDANTKHFAIGEEVPTDNMEEATYKHYLKYGMVSETAPKSPNTKAVRPKRNKAAAPKVTK